MYGYRDSSVTSEFLSSELVSLFLFSRVKRFRVGIPSRSPGKLSTNTLSCQHLVTFQMGINLHWFRLLVLFYTYDQHGGFIAHGVGKKMQSWKNLGRKSG